MNLIKITSTPIKVEFQVTRSQLKVAEPAGVQQNQKTTPSELRIDTKPVRVRMDSSELFSSLDVKSAPRRIQEAADRGMQVAQEATARYAEMGNQFTNFSAGVDVSAIVQQRMLEQPELQTVFLPTTGTAISWEPSSIDIQFTPGTVTTDWEVHRNVMDFVPGKFELSILEYPKITIEYLGGPNYVPPSADPNYEPPAGSQEIE